MCQAWAECQGSGVYGLLRAARTDPTDTVAEQYTCTSPKFRGREHRTQVSAQLAPSEAMRENGPRPRQLLGTSGCLGVPALTTHLWLHCHVAFPLYACLPPDFTS